jgi:hypothetical protein
MSQTELMRLTRTELLVLQRQFAGELPKLAAGSHELRIAHANLQNIRKASLVDPGRTSAGGGGAKRSCLLFQLASSASSANGAASRRANYRKLLACKAANAKASPQGGMS